MPDPNTQALDLSGLTPVEGSLKPLAAPQETLEGLTPVDGTLKPLATPDFNLKQAFTGPNTVGGIIQATSAGAAEGTPYESTAKIGNAVIDAAKSRYNSFHVADHVMAGSPLDWAIRKVNPDFRATGPEYSASSVLTGQMPFVAKPTAEAPSQPDVFNAPAVDVAQFIDKQKHPVLKAISEAGQSMTSPENVGILAATGGFGLVESPVALATANRLLSAGFAAQSIAQAYQNSKSFKAAYDKGDQAESLYQMTHLVLSGAVAVTAGMHAAGAPIPATKGSEVLEYGGKALSKIADVTSDAARAAGKVAGVVKPEAEAAAIQAIKPSNRSIDVFGENWKTAAIDIQDFDKTEPIKTVGDLHEALPQIKDKIWNEDIQPAVNRHANKTVDMSSVKSDVLNSISPEMEEFEPGAANDAKDFADKVGKSRTVAEANRLLTYINGKLSSYFAKNPGAKRIDVLTNPDTAMWETARRGIRENFLKGLENFGEEDIRGARQRYGALTGLQSAVENAAAKLEKSPYGSRALSGLPLFELLGSGVGGGVAALALGPITGGVTTLAGAALAGREMIRRHNANPDVLVRHAIETTEGTPHTTFKGGVPRAPLTPTGEEVNAMGQLAEPVEGAPIKLRRPTLGTGPELPDMDGAEDARTGLPSGTQVGAGTEPATESGVKSPPMPKERSTQNPEWDKIIKNAGAIPSGVQPGFGKHPALVLLSDAKSGTTLAIPETSFSAEAVEKRLSESRAEYAAAKAQPAKTEELDLTDELNASRPAAVTLTDAENESKPGAREVAKDASQQFSKSFGPEFEQNKSLAEWEGKGTNEEVARARVDSPPPTNPEKTSAQRGSSSFGTAGDRLKSALRSAREVGSPLERKIFGQFLADHNLNLAFPADVLNLHSDSPAISAKIHILQKAFFADMISAEKSNDVAKAMSDALREAKDLGK